MTELFVKQALLPDGWKKDVSLVIGPDGTFSSVKADTQPSARAEQLDVALPSQISLHSHAFQRGMAGLAERRQTPSDTFWTWRTLMYKLAGSISPEQMQVIGAYLYMEMLRAGYTQVAEFHYMHRDKAGALYNNPAEMALRVVSGAQTVGLGITVLPTLYMYSGFGERSLLDEQKRFASTPDLIMRICQEVMRTAGVSALVNAGVGLHSLRAADMSSIKSLLDGTVGNVPIHIHISEQMGEVEQCVAATGRRPVDYLFEHISIDARWCLVHATHLSDLEVEKIAKSNAVAGLCPITEANLGDGFFPFVDYVNLNGRFGIGSDSNILISPAEELRTLEYGMRLSAQSRCVALPRGKSGSTGAWLYQQAIAGGAQACGFDKWGLIEGARADICTVDIGKLILPHLDGDAILDAALFSLPAFPVEHVMCAGVWQVRDGRHPLQDTLTSQFRNAMSKILSES